MVCSVGLWRYLQSHSNQLIICVNLAFLHTRLDLNELFGANEIIAYVLQVFVIWQSFKNVTKLRFVEDSHLHDVQIVDELVIFFRASTVIFRSWILTFFNIESQSFVRRLMIIFPYLGFTKPMKADGITVSFHFFQNYFGFGRLEIFLMTVLGWIFDNFFFSMWWTHGLGFNFNILLYFLKLQILHSTWLYKRQHQITIHVAESDFIHICDFRCGHTFSNGVVSICKPFLYQHRNIGNHENFDNQASYTSYYCWMGTAIFLKL